MINMQETVAQPIHEHEKLNILSEIQRKYSISKEDARWIWDQLSYLYHQKRNEIVQNPHTASLITDEWIKQNYRLIKKRLGEGIFSKVEQKKIDSIKEMWLKILILMLKQKSVNHKPRIVFGPTEDKTKFTQEEKIAIETLKLPHRDLSFLKQILQQQTSGGAACVPTSHAYLMMIKSNITDLQQQQTLLNKLLNKWRQENQGSWVQPQTYNDPNDLSEIRVSAIKDPYSFTEIFPLNKLLTFLTSLKGNSFIGSYGDTHVVSEAGKQAAILTTQFSLPSRVVHVSNENPHWQETGKMPPKVNDLIYTAGEHALLAVDYRKNGEQYEIFVIDPQTGSILSINVEDMVAIARKHPGFSNTSVRDTYYGIGTGVL